MREKIKINLTNRWLYTLIGIGIITISGTIYALTVGGTEIPGHSFSNISIPAGCTVNQVMRFNGTDLTCADILTPGGNLASGQLYKCNPGDTPITGTVCSR